MLLQKSSDSDCRIYARKKCKCGTGRVEEGVKGEVLEGGVIIRADNFRFFALIDICTRAFSVWERDREPIL